MKNINLEQIRTGRNQTVLDAVQEIGTRSTSSITDWEKRNKRPHPKYHDAICRFYGISKEEMLAFFYGN